MDPLDKDRLRVQETCLLLPLVLPPEDLSTDYRDRLLSGLRSRYTDGRHCAQEYGYIQDIRGIRAIEGRRILDTYGGVAFTVRVDATTLRPQIGKHVDCRVDTVLPYGILVSHERLKILVSAERLRQKGYVFQKGFVDDAFVHRNRGKIQKNEVLTVELVDLRFENDHFVCLGDLLPFKE